MNLKKMGKALLFPHMVLMILVLPLAAAALTYGMIRLEETDPLRIASYILSAYTLTVWCIRIPSILRSTKHFKTHNPIARRWIEDVHLRVTITLTGNVLWNSAYGVLQLALGIYHRSYWFYSLAGYYICLALMRFLLMRYTLHHQPGQNQMQELRYYRTCGWVFLLMNLALSVMMFCMISENRIVRHHEITTITMAAYTFTSLTMAIINVFKYRKYNSPVFSASKAISLASACVSTLTLEGSMLATFRSDSMTAEAQMLFMSLSGIGIALLIVIMAVYMIKKANQKMKCLETQHG